VWLELIQSPQRSLPSKIARNSRKTRPNFQRRQKWKPVSFQTMHSDHPLLYLRRCRSVVWKVRVIGLGWEWDMQCMGGPSGSLARPSTTWAWIDPTRPCMPATKLYPNHKRFSQLIIYIPLVKADDSKSESIYPTHPDTFSLTDRVGTICNMRGKLPYLKFVEKLGRRRGRHNQVSCVELQETLSLHVIEECKKRVVVSVHVQQTNLPSEST